MKEKNKVSNRKKYLVMVAVVLVIFTGVVAVIKLNKEENSYIYIDNEIVTVDDTTNTIRKQIEEEYDGNPYVVPHKYIEEYEQENIALDSKSIQNDIIEKFKTLSAEELELSINPVDAQLIFTDSTIGIAGKECYPFAVYYYDTDGKLKYVCKYATSIDLKSVYKLDTTKMVYVMVHDDDNVENVEVNQ